ncbi:MAG: hypothetical protein J6W54_01340 [Fibrobacter sp.]|uniref:FISUMP domain-containing protein n=1 Tax=Fibrobacter sp. TaxID=35828 RepID=UPI001B0F8CA7|nr:FISUMP domain-containing protein [Fibrobacter sp.]MBO7059729.1 hypothetical protein [Fibrobacter sp.]
MKKFIFGVFAASFVVTGCLHDSDGGVIGLQNTSDKNIYESVLIKDGYFTDSRDKNKYKIAKIGDEYWFAENLRYADSSKTKNLKKNIGCLDEKSENCEKFGLLYTWTGAMDIADSFTTKVRGSMREWEIQGVCPNGWTIPTEAQWDKLLSRVDYLNSDEGTGTSLKAISSWDESEKAPYGVNRFGFEALAGGRLNSEGGFLSGGKYAYFWAADEIDAGTAKGYSLHYDMDVMNKGQYYKDHGMSIRCILSKSATLTVKGDLDSSYIADIPFDYDTVKIDGKKYKTIKIGEQTWMAENLNYKTGESWCYKDEDSSCDKYGRLYDWETATNLCPEGWKLPSADDFTKLYTFHKDGRFLRSREGWKNEGGLNFWGFNLLPGGGYNDGDFFDEKVSAYLWTSDSSSDYADAFFVSYYGDPSIKPFNKKTGHSVRCIKE